MKSLAYNTTFLEYDTVVGWVLRTDWASECGWESPLCSLKKDWLFQKANIRLKHPIV